MHRDQYSSPREGTYCTSLHANLCTPQSTIVTRFETQLLVRGSSGLVSYCLGLGLKGAYVILAITSLVSPGDYHRACIRKV
jgi:hypothetical protein